MKVFALRPSEDWICDRFVDEWNDMSGVSTQNPRDADVIWLLSDWAWRRVPLDLLESRTVVTTVHHIVPEKFDCTATREFALRDAVTNVYHVPCELTREQVSRLTKKPIVVKPFWVNGDLWRRSSDGKNVIRAKLNIPQESYVIGSFQRDTEGSDLRSPKLEKGPDRFCDAVEQIARARDDVVVLLGGWRRQYVEDRLRKSGTHFIKFERPSLKVVRDMYCALDLYIVAARYEGGPQAIVECAALEVPIVSTPVGLAPEILAPCSVGLDVTRLVPDTRWARDRVDALLIPRGMAGFVELFDSVITVTRSVAKVT